MTTSTTNPTPPDATPDALAAVLHDYMQVTEQLQKTHESLQREVVRLREELASKDRELERRRRLAALGELAAGVAHEVRNPLGAIQLYSNLLKSEVGKLHLDAAVDLIHKIETGVEAIDGVVRDTLALAPRDGKTARFVLADIAQRATDMCEAVLAQQQVRVTLTADGPPAVVSGHPDGLQRVLVNLIGNAAQASPPGATVEVTVTPPEDGLVAVHVADRGCGLPAEVIDRIFDPFFTTKDNGTGLGLTIAHRLAEAHGGQLSAANRPGGGAEFVCVLPTASADGEQTQPASGRRETSAA